MGEPNISELAVAAWRLERWLDNLNAERKMAAKKSLREIKKFLEASEIEIVDPIGWTFDPGLAVEVVNNEADDVEEEKLIIIQTNSPIIKRGGSVIQYGKVILGLKIKEPKENNEIKAKYQPAETGGISSDKKNSSAENIEILQLYDLATGKETSCWVKAFDCKATKAGYKAVICIDSNVDTELLLMDKKVYDEFRKGLFPQNPFRYKGNAGSSYVELPYPDVWYALAWPTSGHIGLEYSFDMFFDWIENRAKTNSVKSINQKGISDSTVSIEKHEEKTTQLGKSCMEQTDSIFPAGDVIQEKQADVLIPGTHNTENKAFWENSDKALELEKKNKLASLLKRGL